VICPLRGRQTWAAAAALAVLAGCAGPTHGTGDYRLKLANTAESLESSAQTVVLAAKLATDKRGFGTYIADVISQAEDDASSVQQTFDSRQPTSQVADELRQNADKTFEQVISTITDARVAARAGDNKSLAQSAAQLRALMADLQKLQQV
jgi:protoporphyrinogen oxidase